MFHWGSARARTRCPWRRAGIPSTAAPIERTGEQVGILRCLGRKHLLDDLEIAARRQARGVFRRRGKQDPALAVGDQHQAALAVLVKEAERNAAEVREVVVSQRIRECEDLQTAGHPLHLGIQHQAHAAHVLEYAAGRVAAVLLVIVEGDADREHDHWQRRSRNQESEPDRQSELWQTGISWFQRDGAGQAKHNAAPVLRHCAFRRACAPASARRASCSAKAAYRLLSVIAAYTMLRSSRRIG